MGLRVLLACAFLSLPANADTVTSLKPGTNEATIDLGAINGIMRGDRVCLAAGQPCGLVGSVLASSSTVVFPSVGAAVGAKVVKMVVVQAAGQPSTAVSPPFLPDLKLPKIRLPTASLDFSILYTVAYLYSPQSPASYKRLIPVGDGYSWVSEGTASEAPIGLKLSIAVPFGRQLVRVSGKGKLYKASSYLYQTIPPTGVTLEGRSLGVSVDWAPLNAKIGDGWVSASVGVDVENSSLTVQAIRAVASATVQSQITVASIRASTDYLLPFDPESGASIGVSLLIPILATADKLVLVEPGLGQALAHTRSQVALELSLGYSFQ